MNRDNTKYSSYWLRNGLFDDDDSLDLNPIESKHSNLVALASYKKSIGNFVDIVTGEHIPVTFDVRGDSYTDGKSVVISSKMDDKDFDSTVGLALHEGSHIKLTDFSTLDTINNNIESVVDKDYITHLMDKHNMDEWECKQWVQKVIKDLLNVIEDRRIDYYIYSTSPGYKGYYHAMYDKYFNSKIVDKGLKSSEYREENWDSYMFRIINITNKNRDLDALPMLKSVWNLMDLKNIDMIKNTDGSLVLASQIFKVIENSLPPSEKPIQSPNQKNDGECDGESDSDEQSEGSGTGGGGDNSDTNGTDNTDGNGGEPKDGSNDTDDSKGDADGDDVKKGSSGGYNPNGAGGSGKDSQITDNKVSDKTHCSEGDGKLSDRQKKMLDNAIQKQKKFNDGNIQKKKVSKTESKKLETLDKSGIEEKLAGKDYQNNRWYGKTDKQTPVMVVRNYTKQLVDSGMISMLSSYSWGVERNEGAINKGIVLGTVLGKKLKLRNEERSLVTPRMKNGKIAGRLLHELGMGNVQIFDQISINKHNPALVHISIDASSSMGGSKWKQTQTSAVAIAKAASMTSNLDVVISYRSIQHDGNTQPLMLIAYDSRKDKFSKVQQLFKFLNPCGTTPEGLCFETVLDDIIKTNKGVDSYFINFSDGWPGFSNRDIDYGGLAAVEHTASQVKKIQQAGVKVLSYFVYDGYEGGIENFKRMYGKSATSVDCTNLMALTKTLNKLFQ